MKFDNYRYFIETVPIHALLGDGATLNTTMMFDPADIVREAEVIIGIDVMSHYHHLIFGRDLMEATARGNSEQFPKTLRIELDHDTEELKMAIALVQTIKGYHEFLNPDGSPIE